MPAAPADAPVASVAAALFAAGAREETTPRQRRAERYQVMLHLEPAALRSAAADDEAWAGGSETALDNLLLLCRHHHRLVHEEGWSVRLVGARALEALDEAHFGG